MSNILPQILAGVSVAAIIYFGPRIYKEMNQVKSIDDQKHSKNQMESVKPVDIRPTPHKQHIKEHLHLPPTHLRHHTGIFKPHFRKVKIF